MCQRMATRRVGMPKPGSSRQFFDALKGATVLAAAPCAHRFLHSTPCREGAEGPGRDSCVPILIRAPRVGKFTIRAVRILTRYILREVLTHALIGAGVFTFVIFMRDLGRLLELVVRNSAPVPSVAEIFFLTLPTALTITIPMGVLIGILIGLSRLAADSEVTAMRAAGMGAGTFVRIVSLFVVLAWLLALVNNTVVAPRSAAALARLQERLKSSQASFEIQPRVFYEDFKDYVLYVQDASSLQGGARWRGVFLADISNPQAPKITLAQSGVVVNEGRDKLRLHLENGSSHETV